MQRERTCLKITVVDGVSIRYIVLMVQPQVPCISDSLCFNDEICRFISACNAQDSHVFVSYTSDVRPVLQCGQPCCGIVAISMAHQVLKGIREVKETKDPLCILQAAKSEGYTKQGEILSAQTMLQLSCETLDCSGIVCNTNELSLSLIMNSISSRKAILVPYDSDKDHTPYIASGHQAHWCIIVGVVLQANSSEPTVQELLIRTDKDSTNRNHFVLRSQENDTVELLERLSIENVYVIARQGKSRHLGFWRLEELRESNENLKELGPRRDPADFVIPKGGLAECLKSKIVILQK